MVPLPQRGRSENEDELTDKPKFERRLPMREIGINIGGCLIEMAKNDTLDLHDYLHRVHLGGLEYKALFNEYKAKYALPESDEQ